MTAPSLAPALTHRRPAFSFGRWLERGGVFSWLMVLPPVAFLAALVGYPFFYGIWLSLQDRPVAKPGVFIGLGDYIGCREDPGVWAGGRQHLRLYRGCHALEDGGRPGARPGHEPGLPLQEPDARAAAAAVHRADRAVDRRLAMDPRSRLQRRQLGAGGERPHHGARPELAGQPLPRDVLADRGQHLAWAPVLRHHLARRPADHLARAL